MELNRYRNSIVKCVVENRVESWQVLRGNLSAKAAHVHTIYSFCTEAITSPLVHKKKERKILSRVRTMQWFSRQYPDIFAVSVVLKDLRLDRLIYQVNPFIVSEWKRRRTSIFVHTRHTGEYSSIFLRCDKKVFQIRLHKEVNYCLFS